MRILPTHDRSPSPNKLRTQPSMSTLHGMSYELQSLEDQVQNKREWKYEMRREAQEILPGLFVGPFQPSWKLEVLQSLGITHILCIAETREQHILKPKFPEHFVYLIQDIRDADDQNLIRIFPQTYNFIDGALAAGGRVLVHCGDGISRSPAIVTAYVMLKTGLTHEDAFTFVQARRFCVAPRTEFVHQLEAYRPIIMASQAVAADKNAQAGQRVRRRGRDDDDDEEGDVSMSGGGGNGIWTPTWPSVFLPRPSGPARKLEQCLNPPSFVLSSTQPRSHRTLDTPRLSLFAAHMSNVTAARCIVHTRFLSVFAPTQIDARMYRTALPTLRTVAYAQRRTFLATRPACDLKDAAQALNKKVGEKLASGIETVEQTTESAKQSAKAATSDATAEAKKLGADAQAKGEKAAADVKAEGRKLEAEAKK
ncbi:Serine/threonine/tyrosine-interacting protein A [Rhodotorula toruloides]|nr:Serine/threonine/tyrosine-interacting protein A [Rhodotorula toruloides]